MLGLHSQQKFSCDRFHKEHLLRQEELPYIRQIVYMDFPGFRCKIGNNLKRYNHLKENFLGAPEFKELMATGMPLGYKADTLLGITAIFLVETNVTGS